MSGDRSTLIRRVAAVLVVVAGCPAALFGGALLGCATQGFSADCALSGIFVSPFILLGAGLVAGLLTRGWIGLALVWAGVLVGMVVLWLIAAALGHVLPLDPVQGVIATTWFWAPTIAGYAIARAGARLLGGGASTTRRPGKAA
jgi:hypothetical protein